MSKEALIKVGKGALIAGTGAALAYCIDAIPNLDLGVWAPVVTALLSVGVNACRKIGK